MPLCRGSFHLPVHRRGNSPRIRDLEGVAAEVANCRVADGAEQRLGVGSTTGSTHVDRPRSGCDGRVGACGKRRNQESRDANQLPLHIPPPMWSEQCTPSFKCLPSLMTSARAIFLHARR